MMTIRAALLAATAAALIGAGSASVSAADLYSASTMKWRGHDSSNDYVPGSKYNLGGSTPLSQGGGGSPLPYTGSYSTTPDLKADVRDAYKLGSNPRATWTGNANTTWYQQ